MKYLKLYENFNWDEEDFDYEEEEETTDFIIYEFLHPYSFCYQYDNNNNPHRVGNIVIDVSRDKWKLFVDTVLKINPNIMWITEKYLEYDGIEYLKSEFPHYNLDSFYMVYSKKYYNRIFFRSKEDFGIKGDDLKIYKL